jgi:hypothetical protein
LGKRNYQRINCSCYTTTGFLQKMLDIAFKHAIHPGKGGQQRVTTPTACLQESTK